uniref:Uncharacterized protein n=1 Tax=Rhizophora mucronata TaxID=61149 RepID=A0A2P2LEL7_RHIMU
MLKIWNSEACLCGQVSFSSGFFPFFFYFLFNLLLYFSLIRLLSCLCIPWMVFQ